MSHTGCGPTNGGFFSVGVNQLRHLGLSAREPVAPGMPITTFTLTATPFKGNGADDDTDLLAEDGDHPNSLGQQAMATAITQSLHSCARCLGQR